MIVEWIRFFLTAACVIAGLIVCCIGVYGMFRFRYAANRMHAAATVDTMGISLVCLGFAISAPDLFSALKIMLVVVFWWLSSPVSSHLLCRLEIITDEQRDQYMIVHKHTIEEENRENTKQDDAADAAAEHTEEVEAQ